MKRVTTSFFIFNMVLGTILVTTSKHWFLMWMGLETKTMSIIPLMSFLQKRRNVEASVKYFIVQALAAAMMLKAALMKVWKKGSWLMNNPLKEMSSKMMTMALFLKLSMTPLHFWYPEVMSGVKLIKGLMMTTWQKIAPTMIILSMMKNLNMKMLMTCSMSSILVGGWGGLKQTQTRKMLAFSSMSHMGWMMLVSIYNPKMSLIMFTMYMIIKTSVFLNFMNKKTMKMAKAKKKNLVNPWKASSLILVMLSLGGLPPLTGFLKKMLALKILVSKGMILTNMPLMMGSLTSLFFYLRMAFKTKMFMFPQNSMLILKMRNKNKPKMSVNAMTKIISMAGIMVMPIIMSMMK